MSGTTPPLLVALVANDDAARQSMTAPTLGMLLIQRDTRKLWYWGGAAWILAALGG